MYSNWPVDRTRWYTRYPNATPRGQGTGCTDFLLANIFFPRFPPFFPVAAARLPLLPFPCGKMHNGMRDPSEETPGGTCAASSSRTKFIDASHQRPSAMGSGRGRGVTGSESGLEGEFPGIRLVCLIFTAAAAGELKSDVPRRVHGVSEGKTL